MKRKLGSGNRGRESGCMAGWRRLPGHGRQITPMARAVDYLASTSTDNIMTTVRVSARIPGRGVACVRREQAVVLEAVR